MEPSGQKEKNQNLQKSRLKKLAKIDIQTQGERRENENKKAGEEKGRKLGEKLITGISPKRESKRDWAHCRKSQRNCGFASNKKQRPITNKRPWRWAQVKKTRDVRLGGQSATIANVKNRIMPKNTGNRLFVLAPILRIFYNGVRGRQRWANFSLEWEPGNNSRGMGKSDLPGGNLVTRQGGAFGNI